MPDNEEGIFIPVHFRSDDLEREGEQVKEKVGRIADDVERRSRRSSANRPSSLGGGGGGGGGGGIAGMLGGGGGIMGMIGMATGIGGISSLVTTLMSVTGISEKLGKGFEALTESGAKLFGIETERAKAEERKLEQMQAQLEMLRTSDPREQAGLAWKQELSDISQKDLKGEVLTTAMDTARERFRGRMATIERQEFAAGAAKLEIDPSQKLSTEELTAIRKAVEEMSKNTKRQADNAERYGKLSGSGTPENF